MRRPRLSRCPRCGERAFEHLESYSHCASCFMFEEFHHEKDELLDFVGSIQ